MAVAPMELVVLAFEEFTPQGEIAKELASLVDRNIIRIVDVLFVSKSPEGVVTMIEVDNLPDVVRDAFTAVADEVDGLIGEEDVADIADSLPAGAAAGLLLFEHTWVAGLREKVLAAGGEVVLAQHIPADAVQSVLDAVKENG